MGIYKKLCLTIAFFGFSYIIAEAQNFIGMHKDEICQVMKANYKGYKLNTENINPIHKYLKYEDIINEITILYFLSASDKCTMVRKMCDYSNINDEIKYLNKTYDNVKKNQWQYTFDGNKYTVDIVEGEWYFTVSTKKK